MTTCREPNGFTTQVQILISKWRSYSFRRDNHLSYRKESWGCNIQLGTEVSNWLHQRLWKDHHLRLTERIPLHSRGAKGTNIMRPLLTLRRVPVIRFRYDRPDQRRFSFCYATIKSRKQFAARNSHKGDGRTAAWAILFNDGTLKRRGYLIHFRHEFWQIPLPRWKCIFVNNFSVHRFRSSFPLYQNTLWYAHNASAALEHRLSVDSQNTVICKQLCPPPNSVRSRIGFFCCISHLIHSWDRQAKGVTATVFFRSHCFCFDCRHPRLGQSLG